MVILSMQGKKNNAPLSHCIFHITSNKTHQFCLWNSLLWFSPILYYIRIHLPRIMENNYSQQMYTQNVDLSGRTTNMWRKPPSPGKVITIILASYVYLFMWYFYYFYVILISLNIKNKSLFKTWLDGFIFDSSDSNYVSKVMRKIGIHFKLI